VKLLVVEDNRKFSGFLVRALTEEGYVVDALYDGAHVLVQTDAIAYDAIILDWMLPSMDGVSVCRALRAAGHHMPVLLLTARNETNERVLGLDAGADDYIVKPFEFEEFLARVRAALRRTSFADTSNSVVGSLLLKHVQRMAVFGGRTLELTNREFAVLAHLVRENGRVVSRFELLAKVWQIAFDPSSNVVDVHIRNLREKLGSQAIETVRGAGYRVTVESLTLPRERA
jgi:two-component system, OmpR family, response regulator